MLTHNIKIQGPSDSESDNGFGAHMMIKENAKAYISHIELFRVGQKSIMGRYPFHWHLLADGGNGQYIEHSSVHKSFNRAITIHGTHQTLVDDNVCYSHIGHGIFLEDGSEENNTIRGNFVLHTMRPVQGEELTPSDNQFAKIQNQTPASFWITNPKNIFSDNVAAGTEGTGFWFAFPQSPMGLSANDSRFDNIEPYKNPLLLFKDNTAHSCSNGIDVFDQLSPQHEINTNGGWEHSGDHIIENCLFYANDLAIYTGVGKRDVVEVNTENLIFKNNVLVENIIGVMFASYSILKSSVIVSSTSLELLPSIVDRYAYQLYDGAGQVIDSYFVGWNGANTYLLRNGGAQSKHPNHNFKGNTADFSPNFSLLNYDLGVPDSDTTQGTLYHSRKWLVVIREDGGICGTAGSIVSNHPFLLVGDEALLPNSTNVHLSAHKFALSDTQHPGASNTSYPNVTMTRSGNEANTESVYCPADFEKKNLDVIKFQLL